MAVTLTNSNLPIPENFHEVVYSAAQEESIVTRLIPNDPMPVGKQTYSIFRGGIEVGPVAEGTSKPVSLPTFGKVTVSPIKVATIVPVSDEQARTDPAGAMALIQAELGRAIGRGIDALVLHGRSSLDGAKYNARTGLTDGTTKRIELVGNDYKTAIEAAYAAASTDWDPTQWIFDSGSKIAVAKAVHDKEFGIANLAVRELDVAGLPTTFSRKLSKVQNVDTKVRGLVGDFSQVHWGFSDDVSITRTTEGSATHGGVTYNAFQDNLILHRVEAEISFVVLDPEAFAVIVDEA